MLNSESLPQASEPGRENQATGSTADGAISVPPPWAAPPSPKPGRGIAIGLVLLLLAFFLASTPVRNSDFWLHLATGKNLLEGTDSSFVYQEDSRSSQYRLYDILVYACFSRFGGTTLAFVKALLAIGIALTMIAAGRIGRSLWGAGAATLLGLLAMGPWLVFRPVFFSYLFFALTLYVLRKLAEGGVTVKRGALLAAIFVLWANMDQWFVLGLLLVPLFWLAHMTGCRARQTQSAAARQLPWLILSLICAGACLINPNHVAVFMPAADWALSPVARELDVDPLLRAHLLAPWRGLYVPNFVHPNGPGLGFWLLVILGLASLVFPGGSSARRRALVWTPFLLLSLWQTQVIPFFAIVGGVMLALTMGECWSQEQRGTTRGWASVGKAGLMLVAVVLLAAAWIGSFQSGLVEPRGWSVEIDDSIRLVADQLTSWRRQGFLREGNGFHFAPETANQLAWLCQEKGFLNSHLHVSPAAAHDYVAVRNGLLGRAGSEATNWRDILRAHHINHIVVYSIDSAETEQAVGNLINRPQEWPLLYLSGGAAIFGWRDKTRPGARYSFAGLETSLGQLAFDPAATPLAPEVWPGREPRRVPWWDVFWTPRQRPSADLLEASMALACFDALAPAQIDRNRVMWNVCLSASQVADRTLLAGLPVERATALTRRQLFFGSQDKGPPEALLLAIRAARRALHRDCNAARGYFILGEAYNRFRLTRERVWARLSPTVGRIRSVQAITAYHNALAVEPEFLEAHERLAALFLSMDYKDLALKHFNEVIRINRQRGPLPGEHRQDFAKRVAEPERIADKLTKEVEELLERYEVNSAYLKVLDRALLAGRLGMPAKALEILLESDVSAFGTDGMDQELKLLLITGEAEKVRLWMQEEQESILDAYHWNNVQLQAAIGNYQLADQELAALVSMKAMHRKDLTFRTAAGLILGHGVLTTSTGGLFQRMPLKPFVATGALPLNTYRLFPDEEEVLLGLWLTVKDLDREARVMVLRGLLALEMGRVAQAQVWFQKTLTVLNSASVRPFRFQAESRAARLIAAYWQDAVARSAQSTTGPPSRAASAKALAAGDGS